VGHTEARKEMGPRYKILVVKAEKIRPLKYLDVDGRAILNWALVKKSVGLSIGLKWLSKQYNGSLLRTSNGLSLSLKQGNKFARL
jgi:hypothetical protein